MELTADERAELRALVNSAEAPATVATRARIVLWRAEQRPKKQVAELAGVTRPTVDLWLSRYAGDGIAGLLDRPRGAGREQVPASIRARILAVARTSPPAEMGLSHWSSRAMAAFISRTEGVYVSHHYVATLWREHGIRPHRQGTFKRSKDPAFAAKVADIVGLYLDPPGGAVVLSLDEKTQVQALDRTQPLLPIAFDATEKRTHDYVRHESVRRAERGHRRGRRRVQAQQGRQGLPDLLEEGSQTSCGQADPRGAGQPVYPRHARGHCLAEAHPHVRFHFTPVGSSWINQIETWFSIITRQSIRRGTFSSVGTLTTQIRRYIDHWNATAEPFAWTATADEILAKVQLVQTNIKQLVDNNAK
jgi:transposase